jgi:serine/threonine protein kinase
MQGTYRNRPVAIKKITAADLPEDAMNEFRHEVEIMSNMNHPNICEPPTTIPEAWREQSIINGNFLCYCLVSSSFCLIGLYFVKSGFRFFLFLFFFFQLIGLVD